MKYYSHTIEATPSFDKSSNLYTMNVGKVVGRNCLKQNGWTNCENANYWTNGHNTGHYNNISKHWLFDNDILCQKDIVTKQEIINTCQHMENKEWNLINI
tara:strand:+ start:426 stop:725 length:300 start_codon:yes stop_codon:yes gene_type:complete